MTIWKSIPCLDDKFEASDEGHIRDAKTGALLSEKALNSGYLSVYCKGYGLGLVHRLVCSAFHPNLDLDKQVNHINGVVTDNRASNLEWLSLGDNVRDFWRNPIFKEKQDKRKAQVGKCMRERIWITDGEVNFRIIPEKLGDYPTFHRGRTRKKASL